VVRLKISRETNNENIKTKNISGGSIMQKPLKRIHRESKGFTLVELLIVVAIMGVLAAVVLPNVTGLVGEGETEAAKAELVTVQTAVDTMMAKEGISSGLECTTSTATMSSFPTASHPLYPNYLRMATTSENYTCSDTGLVTQQ
jgi:type IV pilus assembly protein PilA